MVLTLDKLTVGYDLASVKRVSKTEGRYTRLFLHVTTVATETPSYLRRKFASNVQQVLEITNPQLTYGITSAESSLFVLGYGMVYDQEQERQIRRVMAKVSVSSGSDGSRVVNIESARLNGFLDVYERILQNDLVNNGKII